MLPIGHRHNINIFYIMFICPILFYFIVNYKIFETIEIVIIIFSMVLVFMKLTIEIDEIIFLSISMDLFYSMRTLFNAQRKPLGPGT